MYGDDIEYETEPHKIIIYVSKGKFKYVESCKAFGTHFLEQILDKNNTVVKETIKKNPYYIELSKDTRNMDWD